MKEKVVFASILAFGMLLMGFSIRTGLIAFKELDRHVTVKGLAEREVKADKVTWALKYKEIGNDPMDMYSRFERKNQTVVQFLKDGGLTDEEIDVNPPTIVDRQADNYGNETMNYRYKATSIITVTSKQVDKVRALMSKQTELLKSGIPITAEDYSPTSNISYEFTGLNEIKPAMVEEATKNARKTAEKFAEDSGSVLGAIKEASQGQVSIEDRDVNTPYIKRVRVVNTIEYYLAD